MGINSIEALKGNRLMLRGVGLNEKELEILGIKHLSLIHIYCARSHRTTFLY